MEERAKARVVRYIALDIHKHYCVIAGVNREGRTLLYTRARPAGGWMPTGGGKNTLAWEDNGITQMIIDNTLPKDDLLKIAESLGK